ncbi:NUDIX hydrolase [Candidatus Woesearchaeota archaeon]|nr:MAG: ADP-ribose pyrophosphatase [archaeon GW2011_AR18]MBS3162158.1 NUDIX hydrolase [Candidatus Woesearchaeota archaeon]HIH26248.1 NUDIX hydrolase [Nanoarchaeota archaeon]
MDLNKWKKIEEKPVYEGYQKIYIKKFEMPDGKIGEFEVRKSKDSIGILAITKDNKVIIAREFRVGVEKVLDELPTGIMDDKEEPIEAAKRELLEETGYTGEFEFVAKFPRSPYVTGYTYCFVAKNCVKIKEPENGEKEYIEVVLKPLEQFRKELKQPNNTMVLTGYLGLDHLGLL